MLEYFFCSLTTTVYYPMEHEVIVRHLFICVHLDTFNL